MMLGISCLYILAFLWSGNNNLQGPDQSETKPVVRNKEHRHPHISIKSSQVKLHVKDVLQ